MTSDSDLWPDEFTDPDKASTKVLICPGPAGTAALTVAAGFQSVRLELPAGELPRLTRSLHKACGLPDPIVLARPEIGAGISVSSPDRNMSEGHGWHVGRSTKPGRPVQVDCEDDLTRESALAMAALIAAFAELPAEPDPSVVALLVANGTGHDHARRLARALAASGLLKDGES